MGHRVLILLAALAGVAPAGGGRIVGWVYVPVADGKHAAAAAVVVSTILVLPNRRHAKVGADCRNTISGVPAGTWTVFAYTRRAPKPSSAKITVTAGQDATLDLALVRGAEPEHLNKYGEKYHDA